MSPPCGGWISRPAKCWRNAGCLPGTSEKARRLAGDFIVQLTWEAGIGFVYTLDQLRLVREFRYSGEGWGLTFDGEHLVMSDGSDSLRFLDPDTMREVRTLQVTADGEPLPQLNELEWIDGEIWANIWTEDRLGPHPSRHRGGRRFRGSGRHPSACLSGAVSGN